MKRREAAIVSAYTGYLIGEFDDLHEFVDKELGFTGITTAGFAYAADAIQEAARPYFVELSNQITGDSAPTRSPHGP